MSDWWIGEDKAADRIMSSVQRQARRLDDTPPTVRQVTMVMRALADHTALKQATRWRADVDTATCVGRWLHDLADHLDLDGPDE